MIKKQKIAVYTHGCRLNQYESDGILGKFLSSGRYEQVNWNEKPDIAVINTCTVTSDADSGNRNSIRKIIKKNPGAKVIVTGCHAQTNPEDIQKLEGVDLVVGNQKKSLLFENFEKQLFNGHVISDSLHEELAESEDSEERFNYGVVLPQGHVRAYFKIQDGCNRKCSYCKIPFARGKGVSLSFERLMESFQELRRRKVPEIVLTGVNLGWYRDRKANLRFNHVLSRMLDQAGEMRIRLSSIEPCDVDEELAELTLHPNFCNYLHVPLQSGSRSILRKMRRTYSPESFMKRIEKVRNVNPEIFLGTDAIVGFPSEQEDDFNQTRELCKELEFSKIHVFPYSPRENTDALQISDRVPSETIRMRSQILRELSDQNWKRYAEKFLKKRLSAVVQKENQFGNALTDNYLTLIFDLKKYSYLKAGEVIDFELVTPVQNQKIIARPVQ
ncbi:MAG: tRNA (N(6)-L-threonylcarbamoyladenosine(37)-C(2))-methylthiotransferase MtaB [Spirochaetia bacterium]|nr:tRNA (N(6)-L-threonylcarbamoyladenosine(37)-C(2))-methylthiotransferase MtaB [Spirochaetia bacterium]